MKEAGKGLMGCGCATASLGCLITLIVPVVLGVILLILAA